MNKIKKKILFMAMIFLVIFGPYSCKDWEYNIEKNGIHFKKIYQSKGGTNVGYMTAKHSIQGFPCEKGWIHFKKDWKTSLNEAVLNMIKDFTMDPDFNNVLKNVLKKAR
jgi:hypothetical protein